ncbi:response regulator [Paenibacillus silviterrae]|uniref:response regulator n=1 Tax=Paenibacillus silviterrae TaxID=3242194 RepID=UPI00254362F8|nr:response regulator [Paenibacillus chinjuensis]
MSNKHIVIVDDQYSIRLLLKVALEADGHEVFDTAEGHVALKYMEETQVDIALLDLKMPGMDGLELLTCMRHKGIPTPVVMMTAYMESSLIKEAQKLGLLGYMSKPFDIDEMRSIVSSVVPGA